MKITLEINDAEGAIPDADELVLLFNNQWSEPCWPGYWDGESWVHQDGFRLTRQAAKDHHDHDFLPPTHWSRMPHLSDATQTEVPA